MDTWSDIVEGTGTGSKVSLLSRPSLKANAMYVWKGKNKMKVAQKDRQSQKTDKVKRPTKSKKTDKVIKDRQSQKRPTKSKKTDKVKRSTKSKKTDKVKRPTKSKKTDKVKRPTKFKDTFLKSSQLELDSKSIFCQNEYNTFFM
jgi:outer membrane biosynthesis protein TonB